MWARTGGELGQPAARGERLLQQGWPGGEVVMFLFRWVMKTTLNPRFNPSLTAHPTTNAPWCTPLSFCRTSPAPHTLLDPQRAAPSLSLEQNTSSPGGSKVWREDLVWSPAQTREARECALLHLAPIYFWLFNLAGVTSKDTFTLFLLLCLYQGEKVIGCSDTSVPSDDCVFN